MNENKDHTGTEIIGLNDLQTDFLNLRVGEEIPRLRIRQIRKITNNNRQGNLSGVDYRYIIETKDNKILTVNSWILWKKIAAAIQNAGRIDVDLELKHIGFEEYSVRII